MAEYIEREALRDKISDTDWYHLTTHGNLVIGANDEDSALYKAKDVFNAVETAPAADVVEARHGVWVWDAETHGDPMYGVDEDFGYRCSECQMWADEWGVDGDIYEEPPTRLYYCPNCGAKMDGKGDARWFRRKNVKS